MTKSLLQGLVLVSMMIAYVGQSLAYAAIPCEMDHDMPQIQSKAHTDTIVHHDMAHHKMTHHKVDHGEHEHSSMVHEVIEQGSHAANHDCCDNDCSCPVSACSGMSLLTNHIDIAPMAFINDSVNLQLVTQTQSVISQLFRPPIIA